MKGHHIYRPLSTLPTFTPDETYLKEREHIFYRANKYIDALREDVRRKRLELESAKESSGPESTGAFQIGNRVMRSATVTLGSRSMPTLKIRKMKQNMAVSLPKLERGSIKNKGGNHGWKKEERILKAQLRNLESTLSKRRRAWQGIIKYHDHERLLVQHKQRLRLRQMWLIVVKLISSSRPFSAAIVQRRMEKRAQETMGLACARVQGFFKKSYNRRMGNKHARTKEILLERLWIARLNVRSRMRRNGAHIVRDFVKEASKVGPFVCIIRKFRHSVIKCQRFVKAFFRINRARIASVAKVWAQREPKVILKVVGEKERIKQARQQREAQQSALRAKKARDVKKLKKDAQAQKISTAGGAIQRLVREINDKARSLDSIAHRTRPDMSKDSVKRQQLANSRLARKRALKRRTSPAIRNKIIRDYLREQRLKFIAMDALTIDAKGKIHKPPVKFTVNDCSKILNSESVLDIGNLQQEKEEEEERIRQSRIMVVYGRIASDIDALVLRGLKEQDEADKKAAMEFYSSVN